MRDCILDQERKFLIRVPPEPTRKAANMSEKPSRPDRVTLSGGSTISRENFDRITARAKELEEAGTSKSETQIAQELDLQPLVVRAVLQTAAAQRRRLDQESSEK